MPDLDLPAIVILGLACFRLTHLVVADTITAPLRAFLVNEVYEPDAAGRFVHLQHPKPPAWRGYLGTLIGCTWCTGIWAAVGLVAVWQHVPAFGKPLAWILAVAGLGIIAEMFTYYCKVNSFSPTAAQLDRLKATRDMLMGPEGAATAAGAEPRG